MVEERKKKKHVCVSEFWVAEIEFVMDFLVTWR